jgi:hypothetical protein
LLGLAQLNKKLNPRRQGILGRDQVIFTMKGSVSAFKKGKTATLADNFKALAKI